MSGTVLNAPASALSREWTLNLAATQSELTPSVDPGKDLDRLMEIGDLAARVDDTEEHARAAHASIDSVVSDYGPGLESFNFTNTAIGVGDRIRQAITAILKFCADLLRMLRDAAKQTIAFSNSKNPVIRRSLKTALGLVTSERFQGQRLTVKMNANSSQLLSVDGKIPTDLPQVIQKEAELISQVANQNQSMFLVGVANDMRDKILMDEGSALEITLRTYTQYLQLSNAYRLGPNFKPDTEHNGLMTKVDRELLGGHKAVRRALVSVRDEGVSDINFLGYHIVESVNRRSSGVNLVMSSSDIAASIKELLEYMDATERLMRRLSSDIPAIERAETMLKRTISQNQARVQFHKELRHPVRILTAIMTNAPRYPIQLLRNSNRTIAAVSSLLQFAITLAPNTGN